MGIWPSDDLTIECAQGKAEAASLLDTRALVLVNVHLKVVECIQDSPTAIIIRDYLYIPSGFGVISTVLVYAYQSWWKRNPPCISKIRPATSDRRMIRIERLPETIRSNKMFLNAALKVLENLVLGSSGECDGTHIRFTPDFS
jgi:hypothetical protein